MPNQPNERRNIKKKFGFPAEHVLRSTRQSLLVVIHIQYAQCADAILSIQTKNVRQSILCIEISRSLTRTLRARTYTYIPSASHNHHIDMEASHLTFSVFHITITLALIVHSHRWIKTQFSLQWCALNGNYCIIGAPWLLLASSSSSSFRSHGVGSFAGVTQQELPAGWLMRTVKTNTRTRAHTHTQTDSEK